jgi:SnoaL-like domain
MNIAERYGPNALAARQEITELIYRYCRSVDRLDVPLGHSIWHDDAIADYGADVYQGDGRGVIDHICAQHLHTLHHSHQVSNILIELDGDRAASEAYVTASLRVRRGAQLMQITVWSRYVDRWSRRQGRWALDHRLAVRDFDEIREVVAMKEHDAGRRDRSDPSYSALTMKGFG